MDYGHSLRSEDDLCSVPVKVVFHSKVRYNADMSKYFLLKHLQSEVEKAGSQKALANRLGISQQYLNDVLKGRREPGDKILYPLGFQRIVTYTRIVT